MSQDADANPKWIPKWLRHPKTRDWGCPLCLLGYQWLTNDVSFNNTGWVIPYFLTFLLSWAALSTYWDFTGKDSFFLHGLGCGLAGIPLIWAGVPIELIVLRILICSLGMGLWSKYVTVDAPQEMGRGAIFIL
jgi:hypothetical protein